jgi:DNA invertase Pin-like site-specific DNA recombinase
MGYKGNAIVAARLSRKHRSGQGIGIDTQDSYSREFAERDGWNVIAVVADTKSGTVAPWDRKNLKQWVTEPDKLALYDVIIAYATDRVSRGDQEDFTRIEHWATAHGKRIIIVDGPQYPARDDADYWRWQAEKRLARQEWEQIRERNGRFQRQIIARGKLVGGAPWGYEITGDEYDKTIVPSELGRKWVPRILDRCIAGDSLADIAAWLDSEEVPTAARLAAEKHGKAHTAGGWHPRVIGAIIRNTTYMGYRRSEAGKLLLRCEAIVDSGTWKQANEALAGRPKRGPVVDRNRALCSSVLFCADCGGESPMYKIRSGGREITYYRCTGRGSSRKGCGNNIRVEVVDSLVCDAMETLNAPVMRQVFTPGNDHSAELADVQFRLKQLGAEDLDDEEYDRRLAELRTERDRIRELPIDPGRVDWIDTGETYARKWESLDGLGRNDWLRSVARAWVSRQGHIPALAAAGPMTIQDIPRVLVRQAGDITLSIILGSLSSSAAPALRPFPAAFSPGGRTRGSA